MNIILYIHHIFKYINLSHYVIERLQFGKVNFYVYLRKRKHQTAKQQKIIKTKFKVILEGKYYFYLGGKM